MTITFEELRKRLRDRDIIYRPEDLGIGYGNVLVFRETLTYIDRRAAKDLAKYFGITAEELEDE